MLNKKTLLSPLLLSLVLGSALAEPSQVIIQRNDNGPSLFLNGKPFEIKGAGGGDDFALLKTCGGNAVRTWGIDEATTELLDEAQQQGIKVALGYWLGHERHGFQYTDWDSVIKQADNLFAAVNKYKDHPAVLLWAIGNEMEGFTPESNPAIYTQIEYLARNIKKLDPNHPTMTITAEIGKRQIEALNRFCPSIDIHGINSYGGAPSIPQRYKEQGGVKPYIITEFGPPGIWEVPTNKWGMVDELTSTEKASFYRQSYEVISADPLCLGSFAFTWGSKQETSATWFGMLLPSGEKLACVDELTKLWSGKPSTNLCPKIESFELEGPNELLDPGAVIEVKLKASDPENDPLKFKFLLTEDWKEVAEGGDHRMSPPTYPESTLPGATGTGAKIRMPNDGGGTYRVYVFVYDGQGGAATASLSINIKGERKPVAAEKLALPLTITGAAKNAPWTASGWMGDITKLKLDEQSAKAPKVGDQCTEISFTSDSGWAGVVWQHPPGDWGDAPGGFDLTGAKRLSFWAKGSEGGEKATVGIGIVGKEKPYHDTVKKEIKIELTNEWVKYEMDLTGADLSRVKSALYFSTASQGKPFSFYLDEVVVE